MIRIGICDDEPLICSQLEKMILDYQLQTNEKIEIDVFYTGEELVKHLLQEASFDLIFLDIELGTVNGVEIGHFIRTKMDDYITKIIYISSKNIYDRQLFDVQPLHFLPKPLDPKKVHQDISLAFKMLRKEKHIFSFKVGHENYRVPLKKIIYFESMSREIKLITTNDQFLFYDKLTSVMQTLAGFRFMHPHRCYFINYDHTIRIEHSTITMSNNHNIPISEYKAGEIKLLQLKFEEEGI